MKTQIVFFTMLMLGQIVGFQNCAPVKFYMDPTSNDSVGGTPTVLVCDPFVQNSKCSGNVTAKIYRLDADQRAQYGSQGVDTYFDYGTQLNATIQLDQLFIPTEPFTTGFPSVAGDYLQDENGDKLIEYFAMKLKTSITMPPDAPGGTYQIALLSDDGSRLILDSTGEKLIDNDGDHPTQLGCPTRTIDIHPGDKIPVTIDYYQGPRMHIALSLLWRKVDSSTNLNESLCGQNGNDMYFGPNYDDSSNAYGYGQLTDRGWSPIPASNLTRVEN